MHPNHPQTGYQGEYQDGAVTDEEIEGANFVHTVVWSAGVNAVTLYNGAAAGGDIVAIFSSATVSGYLLLDAAFPDGVFYTTTGAAPITITWL